MWEQSSDREGTPVLRGDEDRLLVEDPALPGGRLILTSSRLETWLSENLGQRCSVRPRRLRYRPGTSVTLGFDLTVERDGVKVTEPCLARTYASHAAVKLSKTVKTVPMSTCLARDTGTHTLVTTAGGDRALPTLGRLLHRPDGVARVLEKLLHDASGLDRASLRTIRYTPGSRWVGVLEREGEPDLVLRTYHDGTKMRRAAESYSALERGTSVRTPCLVARSRSLGLVAVTWMDGQELAATIRPDVWSAAGRALATLHGSDPGMRLHTSGPASDVAAVERTARQVAKLLPERRADAAHLAETLARLLELVPRDRAALHGGLSPDQVVISPDGRPGLIDLDSAGWGPSAADLGGFIASTLNAAEATGMAQRGVRSVDAMLGGYAEVRRAPDPFALAVHTLAHRLREAVDPFRTCSPTWREQVGERLTNARIQLEELSSAGSGR